MSLNEIQRAVAVLPSEERLRLTAWMVSHYPLLSVEQLMTHASQMVTRGEWSPAAPTDDNRVKGKVHEHAIRVAEELDLGQ